MSKALTILKQVREQHFFKKDFKEKLFGKAPDYNELNIRRQYLNANDWQEFKRKFVLEYDGEPVEPTGMTHSEFLHYIKTSGERENDQYTHTRNLRNILKD
jgi:hypothetical protein